MLSKNSKKHAQSHVKTAIWGGFSAPKNFVQKLVV